MIGDPTPKITNLVSTHFLSIDFETVPTIGIGFIGMVLIGGTIMSEYRSIKSQEKLDRILHDLFDFIRNEPDKTRQSFVSWLVKELGFRFDMDVKVMPPQDISKLITYQRNTLWTFKSLLENPAMRGQAYEQIHELLHDLLNYMQRNR